MTETRTCQNCKQDFIVQPADFDFYKKVSVPPPTFCPDCRMQRRLAFRNERRLYKRISDFSGQEIFSMFSPEAQIKVCELSAWYGDDWDPLSYSKEVDFTRPFFEQVGSLIRTVPLPALSVIRMMNSDYCNNAGDLRNCYLLFNSNYDEDCFYGNGVNNVKDSVSNSHISHSERMYECFWMTHCNHAFFSSRCESSSDIFFSTNLRGCSYCFGCANLVNKNYCIFNKQVSRKDFEDYLKEARLGSYESVKRWRDTAEKFALGFPNKYFEGVKNTGITGNYVFNSKNVIDSYLVRGGEDLRYCQYLEMPPNKDCYDFSVWGDNNALVYECAVCGYGANNIKFCAESWTDVKDLEYCYHCESSSNLFGCVSLRHKQYCILNKQYSKEEYEELVPRIREHMSVVPFVDREGLIYRYGEFFPMEFSPFSYDETLAYEQFPIDRAGAELKKYVWRGPEKRGHTPTVQAADLPDHIVDVDDAITKEVIGCPHRGECRDNCTVAFRIIPDELQFYRKNGLPVPRLCPNCRHHERIAKRSPFKLWTRKCGCGGGRSQNGAYINAIPHSHGSDRCPNQFKTSYSPDRPEIVYCEACYQAEVV